MIPPSTNFAGHFPTFCGRQKVEPAEAKPKTVIVGGQVTKPGPIEYKDKTTIYSMIFAAGGPTNFGSLKRVKVYRHGKPFTLDPTNDQSKNEALAEPDDTIEVPQKNVWSK